MISHRLPRPSPLLFVELARSAWFDRYKIQPKVKNSFSDMFRCYRDVMKMFFLFVGPLQLVSYLSIRERKLVFVADAYIESNVINVPYYGKMSWANTLCSECSLVLESHSIDETSEWRTFANESSNSDPNRVGGPTNPLLTNSAFTTVIAKTNGSSGDILSNSLGRWQNHNGSAELGLIQAFKTIATMSERVLTCLIALCKFMSCYSCLEVCVHCEITYSLIDFRFHRLGLVGTIKDRANEIFKRLEDQKSIRGRNQDVLLAACLYISCRQEDKPRTIKG
ncbi:hypothetical protein Bca4012_010041 [Brassica carinata]